MNVELVARRSALLMAAYVASALVSCRPPLPVHMRSIESISVERMDDAFAYLKVVVRVESTTSRELEINELHGDLVLAGHRLGKMHADPMKLPGDSLSSVPLHLGVELAAVTEDLLGALDGPRVPYEAPIVVDLEGFGRLSSTVRGNLDLTSKINVDIAGVIGSRHFGIAGGDVRRIDGSGADVAVTMAITNPFSFAVEIRSIRYDAWVASIPSGHGVLEQPIRAAPGKTVRFNIVHAAPWPDPADALIALTRPSQLKVVRLKGKIVIAPIAGVREIPFDVKYDLLGSRP